MHVACGAAGVVRRTAGTGAGQGPAQEPARRHLHGPRQGPAQPIRTRHHHSGSLALSLVLIAQLTLT